MHDAFQVGLPILFILFGILLNRQDVTALRNELRTEIGSLRTELHAEIGGLRGEMNSRFDSIQRDLREFYAEQARHDVRISKLERPE